MDKPNAFLYALSPSLIDAIPLFMLPKLRNFLWLGSTGGWNDRESCGQAKERVLLLVVTKSCRSQSLVVVKPRRS